MSLDFPAGSPAAALAPLNPAQQNAATVGGGRHLVLAGPGTGKTTTLVARVVHLISQGADPASITAVTFTRAAADQLRQRITEATGPLPREPRIGTFHALALRWLRQYGAAMGLSPEMELCDEARRGQLLRELRLFWSGSDGRTLADAISLWKSHGLAPEAAAGQAVGEMAKAAHQYGAYQQAMSERGWLDFDDLLLHLAAALEGNEDLRRTVAGAIMHLLVDEVQDVNPVQVRLTEALSSVHGNLWMVGDDDQSIYGFRAADLDFILHFQDTHLDAQIHRLAQSYRAGPALLTAAGTLIAHNTRRHEKTLQGLGPTGRLVLNRLATETAEAQWLAHSIRSALDKGYDPAAIAVLTRTRTLAEALQPALLDAGIPLALRQVRSAWDISPMRPVLNALQLGAEGGATRGLGTGKLADALKAAVAEGAGKPWSQQVAAVARAARKAVPGRWSPDGTLMHHLLGIVIEHAFGCARHGGWPALAALVAAQQGLIRSGGGRDPRAGPAVTLSTIHSAKGLEWEMVFIPGLEAERMPLAGQDAEEERRIAYVGLTRARRILTLSCTRTRHGDLANPSPYLAELALGALPKEAVVWRGEGEPLAALIGDAISGARRDSSDRRAQKDEPAAPPRSPASERRGRRAVPALRETAVPADAPPRHLPLPRDVPSPPAFDWTSKTVARHARNIADGNPPRSNIAWGDAEDDWLRQRVAALVDLDLIAQALERSASAVAARMARLDLVEEDNREAIYRAVCRHGSAAPLPPPVAPLSETLTAPAHLSAPPHERLTQNIAAGRPQRTGQSWEPREDQWLRDRVAERWPLAPLANALERSPSAVGLRLVQLGLVVDLKPQAAYAAACARD